MSLPEFLRAPLSSQVSHQHLQLSDLLRQIRDLLSVLSSTTDQIAYYLLIRISLALQFAVALAQGAQRAHGAVFEAVQIVAEFADHSQVCRHARCDTSVVGYGAGHGLVVVTGYIMQEGKGNWRAGEDVFGVVVRVLSV